MFKRNNDIFSSPRRRPHRSGDYRSASVHSVIGTEGGTKRQGRHAPGAHQARANNRTADPRRRGNGKTVDRGQISHVIPQTRTRETDAQYARRTRREAHSYSMGTTREHDVRRIVLIVIAVAAALAVAGAVAAFVFSHSVSSKMALDDSSAASALTAPANSTDAYYVLVAGDLESSTISGFDGADALILARVDPANTKVSLLGIPANMVVTLSNGSSGPIGSEESIGGDAALIKSVASFAGVDITHFVKTDGSGLSSIVDALGGVNVDVPEEVDDPDVTSVYLAAGQQDLNGSQALAFATARNYSTGSVRRTQNDLTLLKALAAKALAQEGVGQLSAVDSFAGSIKTDYTSDELTGLMDQFKNYDVESSITCVVPGSDSSYSDEKSSSSTTTSATLASFYASSSSWDTTKSAFESGDDPAQVTAKELASVDPSKYTVIVKNGSGETGSADEVANALKKAGYTIDSTGNADQYVYTETLVVYKESSSKTAAEAIASTLGTGRAVSASIYYSFDSDIEVIVGSDWGGTPSDSSSSSSSASSSSSSSSSAE